MARGWLLDSRSVEKLEEIVRWYDAQKRGMPPTHEWRSQVLPVSDDTTFRIRHGILKTDLEPGGTCEIEERTYDYLGRLCVTGSTYTAFDPLGEFYGTADATCCTFWLDPNDPLGRASLLRVTCPNFTCQLCSGVS